MKISRENTKIYRNYDTIFVSNYTVGCRSAVCQTGRRHDGPPVLRAGLGPTHEQVDGGRQQLGVYSAVGTARP